MAQDKVTLFNLAISGIGARGEKLSSPDEEGVLAEECRLHYEHTRDQVLRAAHWPAAKAYSRIALLKERDDTAAWVPDDPEPGWAAVYQAPVDMLYPRHLSTFERFATGINPSPSGDVSAIFTSAETPILFYTRRQDNLALWDPQLFMAIASALSYNISLASTGKLTWADRALDKANSLISAARVSAANEGQQQIDVLPEWISARGYQGQPSNDFYTYPFGPLVGAAPGGGNVR